VEKHLLNPIPAYTRGVIQRDHRMKSKLIGPIAAALLSLLAAPPVTATDAGDESVAAVLATAASSARSSATPDPLGTLLQKLSSEHPADSARLQPLPASDASIDLWQRIRNGFAMPDLETPVAAQVTRWYSAQPDYLVRMAARGNRYLFHIVEEIERRGMPTELALLPFVESAMQPEAESHAKAVGLWQFIPSTGKLYRLEQNLWLDERRDVLESTRAALDYLQKLFDEFGDWHLALAAYNCGEGCVGRAVQRARAGKRSTAYSQLALPRETRGYVPKLQAIKNIVRDPSAYGVELPEIRNEPYFAVVRKTRDIDVETAARLAEMPVEEFRALNPSFNRPLIVGAGQSNLLLPADRAEIFVANLAAFEATGQPLASWTTYSVQGNDTVESIAAKVGVSAESLREANRIPRRQRLAAGSTILVPRDEKMTDDVAPAQLAAALSLLPEAGPQQRVITYRVRRGDTLSSIARRHGLSVEQIVESNQLRSRNVFDGQRLNLAVAPGRAAPAAQPRKVTAQKSGASRS
jgi:membrane-bound lytic murein transglycosylase D